MKINEEYKKIFKQFGKHILKLREDRNITINELSDKTGIRKEYLKKIEQGTAYGLMFERHLVKIAKGLKINFQTLLDFE